MTLTAALVLAYFLAILISLKLRRHDVQSRHLHFLRAFFPNWRFYHAVGHRPTLELRVQSEQEAWSGWIPYFPRAHRHALQFIHNPEINLQLVEQTLIEHLAGDLAEMSDEEEVTDLVSYRLTIRLAQKLAKKLAKKLAQKLALQRMEPIVSPATQAFAYQFRVRLIHALEPQGDNPTVLVSPTLHFDPDDDR
jgi:hypothetical protein